MNVRAIVVFVHVLSMLGLYAALTIERVAGTSQPKDWARLSGWLMPVGMPSIFAALASGIYLATTEGAWELGWVKLAVPVLVGVAVLGGVVGPRRSRAVKALAAGQSLDAAALRHPAFAASWRARTALLLGLVFEMTARPEGAGAFIALGAFAVAGAAWAALAFVPARGAA